MADVVFLDGPEGAAVLGGASCAFGVFDGVHKGHRFLIGESSRMAAERGCASVVLTFDRDPDELFHPDRLHKLLSNEERISALASTGVDAVVVLRFDRDFASLEPGTFLAKTFSGNMPTCIHVGNDIRYGRRASGTLEDLQAWGRLNGVEVVGHELLEQDGAPVTATRIRLLLESGDDQAASELLGW